METLTKLRKARNLSQKQLANKLGVRQTTISSYERGINQADYKTLKKLASFFNVTIDYLLDANSDNLMIITKDQYSKLIKNITQAKSLLTEIEKQNNKTKNNININDNHGKIEIK